MFVGFTYSPTLLPSPSKSADIRLAYFTFTVTSDNVASEEYAVKSLIVIVYSISALSQHRYNC